MGLKRPFTGGQFALELDGSIVGYLKSIDGGHFKSDEVKSQTGITTYLNLVTKYPGKPKYEDITITCGMPNSPDFWRWLKTTVDNDTPERRNGAIVVFDFHHKERQRRSFYNALIAEIGFPALDPMSKEAGSLNIKISPERLRFADGDLSSLAGVQYAQNELSKQKKWMCSNFKFSLDRFKDLETFRAKVEAFAIKQAIMANPIGRMLETHKYGGGVETPSLQVSIPMSEVTPWMEWYEKCVRHGNYIGELTNGTIEYLDSDATTVLMTLHLENVGITSVEFEKLEAHKDGIVKAKVSLYVEKIRMEKGEGTA